MKKKYPNLMMQSASNYDSTEVKKTVEAQIKEEQSDEIVPTNINTDITNSSIPVVADPVPVVETVQTVVVKKVEKPRLRQQAYYLTEQEIKTIKRLSYELDIPKSDLVRKFIDEGIAKIDNANN